MNRLRERNSFETTLPICLYLFLISDLFASRWPESDGMYMEIICIVMGY